MTWRLLYDRMGWSEQNARDWRKRVFLPLRVAAQMGRALEVSDLGKWLFELAREEGIPELGERVILKPSAQAVTRRMNAELRSKRGLKRKRKLKSAALPGATMLRMQAAPPRKWRRKRYKPKKGGRE